MKKKWQYILILILILALSFIIYAYVRKNNGESIFPTKNESKSDTTTSDTASTTTTSNVEASIQTITNTLSSSGAVTSSLTEQLQLHATYYFEEVYYSAGDYVEEGTNILKYSNGTYLTAPYDLVIKSLSLPSSGSECSSKNYVEVESINTLTLSASIEEDDLSKVSVGQEVQITISALDKTYTGCVTKISETGTYSSSGSKFSATITFENDGNVKIGMTASCQIILEKAENVVTVPIEAVTTSGDTKSVVVLKSDGTTENVTVTTGISNNAYIEIKSGLIGTETVRITENTKSSRSGFSGGNTGSMPSGDSQQTQQHGTPPSGTN